jgi:hypothetical protein
MYFNVLTSLPALGTLINSVVKAIKNDNKISLEEAGEISNLLLAFILGLGIPGLNQTKFLRYAPKLIVYVLEIIKQDVEAYKQSINEKDKIITASVNEQFYQIGTAYLYDGVPREDIFVQSVLEY